MFTFPLSEYTHRIRCYIVRLLPFHNASNVDKCEVEEIGQDVVGDSLCQFTQCMDGESWAPGHIVVDEIVDAVGAVVILGLLFTHRGVLHREQHLHGNASRLARREDRFVLEAEIYFSGTCQFVHFLPYGFEYQLLHLGPGRVGVFALVGLVVVFIREAQELDEIRVGYLLVPYLLETGEIYVETRCTFLQSDAGDM